MSAPLPGPADHPHGDGALLRAGVAPAQANAAVILLHGRGAGAEGILALAGEIGRDDIAYLAPQACGNSWYPLGFMAPLEANEPGLSSALRRVSELIEAVEQEGVDRARIVLAGFSQGACLTCEFAARNARRYGGIIGFTGGLIGPPGTERDYDGDFAGTPVFLGSSIPDPHVPWERVEETAEVLNRMGAVVKSSGYRGMPHTINAEEVAEARAIIDRVAVHSGAAPATPAGAS